MNTGGSNEPGGGSPDREECPVKGKAGESSQGGGGGEGVNRSRVKRTPEGGPLYRSYVHHLEIAEQKDQSFEGNQSYPKLHSTHHRALFKFDGGSTRPNRQQLFAKNKDIQDFTGLELNSVNFSRFAPPFAGNRGVRQTDFGSSILSSPNFSADLGALMGRRASDDVCQFKRRGSLLTSPMTPGSPKPPMGSSSANPFFPPPDPTILGKNPNKAVLTVDGTNNKIMIANDMACSLLCMEHSEVVGRSLESLCEDQEEEENSLPNSRKALLRVNSSTLLTNDGLLVPIHGKIIEIVNSSGVKISVSLWIYPLKSQDAIASLKKYSSPTPPLRLSDSMPASVLRTARHSDTSELSFSQSDISPRFLVLMEPIEILTGSCVLGPKGRIFSTAGQISKIFGCKSSSDCLGLSIQDLVPNLVLSSSPCSPLPSTSSQGESAQPSASSTVQYLTGKKIGTDDSEYFPLKLAVEPTTDEEGEVLKYDVEIRVFLSISGVVTIFPSGTLHSFNTNFVRSLLGSTQAELKQESISNILPDFLVTPTDEITEKNLKNSQFSPIASDDEFASNLESLHITPRVPSSSPPKHTSTPSDSCRVREGNFFGHCQHRDGTRFPVIYQVRRLVLKNRDVLFCVWIAWEGNFTEPAASSDHSPQTTSPCVEITSRSEDCGLNSSLSDGEWSEMLAGKYGEDYETLQQIGKGAFGAVKLAARRTDGLLVVTKFMRISKMLADSWILSRDTGKKVPIEVHLLQALSHPNIVKVMNVYATESFYQMVMEKHGCGMDLFDFIDRQPNIDEALISYIFRQIVAAVSYLHSLHIVHRDLKDENVIIDQNFKCKIIDFGSAAYFSSDKMFSTFCGTMEYCSPEVLLGNKYKGPELEMWSLGILLYTLVFFENPFASPEETIDGFYELPFDVSEGLTNLLGSLLYPDPIQRATIDEAEKHWWVTQKLDPTSYNFSRVLPHCEPHEIDPPVHKSGLSTESCNVLHEP